MNTLNQSKSSTRVRLIIFLIIAFGVSNVFRFNIFHLNEIVEKNSKWSYLITHEILGGSGIFCAGLLGLYLLKKERAVDVSFFGTSKVKSILMALVPAILLISIGVRNNYEINVHVYGLIAAFGSFI